MNNFLTELKKYFEINSREEVLKKWNKTERFDDIGIKACDFLFYSEYSFSYKEFDNVNNKQELSSEFFSGLF